MKLTDVVDRINGNVDRFTTELEYYIGGEHFESNELEVTQKGLLKENLGKLGFKFHFAFQDRDVVFMARNPHLRKAGMVRFAGLCSDASYILRSKDETVLSQEYLAVMLQSDHFWDYCESHKVGSVNFANNWSSIANYEFELPTPEEQKEISDKVWAAYRLKKSYKKLLAATEEMVKSQFIEMFYNEKYPLQKLKTHIDVVRGVSYKPVDIKEAGSYRSSVILRSNNIDNGQINFDDVVYVDNRRVTKEQVLSKGDIVMCGSNGSKKLVGKAAMINEIPSYRTSFGAFCIGIRCKESILPKYLSVYFQTSKYRDVIEFLGSGSNILNIKPEHIYNLEIPIPSLEDQKHFVSIAEQADKSGFELRKSIDAIDAVIKSLINS